jgi:glycosyltransferase involved in cell wall biosynthesis
MAWRLHSEEMRQRLVELCRRAYFDAIHIEGIEMAPYGLLAGRLQSGGQSSRFKVAYDAHNAEYLLQGRAFTTDLAHPRRWLRAFYSLAQWWRLRRYERRVCLASRHVVAVSQADRAALERLLPAITGRATVLPNGVDPEHWSREADFPKMELAGSRKSLVFDGTMDFRPNVDAVLWFASEVWPRIRAEQPDSRFFIVGRNPAREVLALANTPGITVTGAVDDTRPWVAAASVYVVPMRMGGGVRLKVLQAMSMGCAIVSTPMGMEGIEAQEGKEVALARSAAQFAQTTLMLLSQEERRAALGQAARALAASRYAWQTLLPALEELYPLH